MWSPLKIRGIFVVGLSIRWRARLFHDYRRNTRHERPADLRMQDLWRYFWHGSLPILIIFHGRSDITENSDLRFLCLVYSTTLRHKLVHPNYDICDLLGLPKLGLKFDGHLFHEVFLEQPLYRQQIDLPLRFLLSGVATHSLVYGPMPIDWMQDPIKLDVLLHLVLIVKMISAGVIHD